MKQDNSMENVYFQQFHYVSTTKLTRLAIVWPQSLNKEEL